MSILSITIFIFDIFTYFFFYILKFSVIYDIFRSLHSFYREMADESFWIEEKLPLASSDQLGHSTSEVQALQKKHDLLEADIKTHEKVGLISSNEATLQIQRVYRLSVRR